MADLFDLAGSIGKLINALLSPDTSDQARRAFLSDDLSFGGIPVGTVGAITEPPHVSMAERAQQEIASLQKIDPDFSELPFLAQASAQYGAALAAESSMNPDCFTGIATPEFIAWFRNRVAVWSGGGQRCVVKDIKLLGSAILKVTLEATRQAVIVRFVGTGIRFTQDTSTGAAVDGDVQSDSFTEFATFVRPAGTTTPKSVAAGGPTHCPSCGAPTAAGAATCPFCGTQLTGTGSTWLLDKLSASPYT